VPVGCFEPNSALGRRRATLGQCPAFHAEALDELEDHLRNGSADLRRRDLSLEEGLLIAGSRLGSPEILKSQFGKVNHKEVWLKEFQAPGLPPSGWDG
jgi:hypothetical protein